MVLYNIPIGPERSDNAIASLWIGGGLADNYLLHWWRLRVWSWCFQRLVIGYGLRSHYHYERLHQALGYRTPRQVFEEALQVATLRRRRKTAGANHELAAQ
jgi:hypothetical protein